MQIMNINKKNNSSINKIKNQRIQKKIKINKDKVINKKICLDKAIKTKIEKIIFL